MVQCTGGGSANVVFDQKTRTLSCKQCGKEEVYSRSRLNSNGKVIYSRENAVKFFSSGQYDNAVHYAQEVLNIAMDNAPALYIMAFTEEVIRKKGNRIKNFFSEVEELVLEYDEVQELKTLFLASPYKLIECEEEVLTLIAKNSQSESDAEDLCKFVDTLCPFLISKRPSSRFLTQNLADIYQELAGHCDIPKTCYALLNSIQTNPDSPYINNSFFLKTKTKSFYDEFVLPVGTIVSSMRNQELRAKFVDSFHKRRQKLEQDAEITG